MNQKMTMTVQEVYNRLQEAGFHFGYVKLREGILQGALPFGQAISSPSGQMMFIIYRKDVEDFIKKYTV